MKNMVFLLPHRRILIISLMIISFSIPARAQDMLEELTKDDVEAFIIKTSAAASGEMQGSPSETIDYLRLHIRDDATFKSKMSYSMPGQEEEDNEMTLTKDDFIQGLETGAQKLKSYSSAIKIKKVKISDKGRKALAITETRDVVTMPVEEGDVMQDVPLEGVSTCEQTLALSDLGIIQMTGANCVTKIEFQSF